MIDFSSSWTWQGRGRLSQRIRSSTGIQHVFKALIDEMKEAGKVFQRLKSNDSRLIGQERHELAKELEDLLGGFFYLYKLVMRVGKNPFYSQFCSKSEQFIVEFKGSAWKAEGNLRKKPVTGSFEEWFNTILLIKIGEFIKNYGDVFSDGIMDYEEKELLLRCLNELILQTLIAEKGLKSGLLQ